DGIVISRSAEVGQTIKGAPTLFTVGDADSAIEIRVSIPRDEASSLVEGLPALASTAYAPDKTFEGRLTGLEGQTDGGAVAAVMKIADADAAALRPGTKVDVNVTVDGRENVLVVPAAALRFTPDRDAEAPQGETKVWVRAVDGALVGRQVDVGLND